jgi:hypothetical protein
LYATEQEAANVKSQIRREAEKAKGGRNSKAKKSKATKMSAAELQKQADLDLANGTSKNMAAATRFRADKVNLEELVKGVEDLMELGSTPEVVNDHIALVIARWTLNHEHTVEYLKLVPEAEADTIRTGMVCLRAKFDEHRKAAKRYAKAWAKRALASPEVPPPPLSTDWVPTPVGQCTRTELEMIMTRSLSRCAIHIGKMKLYANDLVANARTKKRAEELMMVIRAGEKERASHARVAWDYLSPANTNYESLRRRLEADELEAKTILDKAALPGYDDEAKKIYDKAVNSLEIDKVELRSSVRATKPVGDRYGWTEEQLKQQEATNVKSQVRREAEKAKGGKNSKATKMSAAELQGQADLDLANKNQASASELQKQADLEYANKNQASAAELQKQADLDLANGASKNMAAATRFRADKVNLEELVKGVEDLMELGSTPEVVNDHIAMVNYDSVRRRLEADEHEAKKIYDKAVNALEIVKASVGSIGSGNNRAQS